MTDDSPRAGKNKVVRLHYILTDRDGNEVESSRDGDPAVALMGHEGLMAGLEEALAGKQAGERFSVTLPAEKAFGEYVDDLTQRVSKKYVARPARLKVGDQVVLQTEAGPRTVTVIKVGGKFFDADLNHPLAGQEVTFDVELLEVRDATVEEIAHGHVHGEGGHQH